MKEFLILEINRVKPVQPMAAMVTEEESERLYTHQTENVCADPPSKPASQETLACLTPGETDIEVAAWGLVPVTEGNGEELMDNCQQQPPDAAGVQRHLSGGGVEAPERRYRGMCMEEKW